MNNEYAVYHECTTEPDTGEVIEIVQTRADADKRVGELIALANQQMVDNEGRYPTWATETVVFRRVAEVQIRPFDADLYLAECVRPAPAAVSTQIQWVADQTPAKPSGAAFNPFSERETSTILAALRYWQRVNLPRTHREPISEDDIATAGGALAFMTAEEIDALCAEINAGDAGNRQDGATIAAVLVELEGLRDPTSESDADAIYLNGFFTRSIYNDARALVGLKPVEARRSPPNLLKTLEDTTFMLGEAGIAATFEHPGYIEIGIDGMKAQIGGANGEYSIDWTDDKGAHWVRLAGLEAEPRVLAVAIRSWFKARL